MNDDERAMLWTLGTVQGLVEEGLLIGPQTRMTPEGWKEYDKLLMEDYQPTDDQIAKSMAVVMGEFDAELEKAIIASN